ncbi:hypothetical protein PM082_018586 [Marasmius tenuissimus]|nr:hypothetical protein PM082_018586 [Marasmius tenuissimus]
MMCCRYNLDIYTRLLSRNIVRRITLAITCYLPNSDLYKPTDPAYVFHGVASSCCILAQAFDDGLTWGRQALDAGLLPASSTSSYPIWSKEQTTPLISLSPTPDASPGPGKSQNRSLFVWDHSNRSSYLVQS